MGYLTNAIKALFTRNTTNAASVSGARIPIVEQNGNPIGNDSMSNLAAVLGVPPFVRFDDNGDCNTLATTRGIYFHYLSGNISNNPTGTGYLMVMTVYWGSNDQWQLACDIVIGKMWYRCKGSTNWRAWIEIATT